MQENKESLVHHPPLCGGKKERKKTGCLVKRMMGGSFEKLKGL
jgi:hypothetical protein